MYIVSHMFQFKGKLEDYPELGDIKKTQLSKKVKDIFDLGYKLMYPDISKITTQERVIFSQLEQITSNQPQISDLNKSITQLLGITSNSSKKGEMVEGIVEDYIKLKYSEDSYEVKRSEGHCGDGWLTLPNKSKAIVEVKAYSKTVNETEVEKLRYDMKYNQIPYAIMVSLGTKIQNARLIDLEIFNDNGKTFYIIKIGPIFESQDVLEIGFDLLEKISCLDKQEFNKVILEDNLLMKTNLLLEKINKNQQLKDSYRSMTFDIYQKMDGFNQEMSLLFLEQDQLIKQIISEIESNSIHSYILPEDGLVEIEKYKDNKIYLNLVKLIEMINSHKLEYKIVKDKLLSNKVEVKITQEKLGISLVGMNLSISITSKNGDVLSNKNNFELLDKLLG